MIVDCFPFFNELDLLEIRLHELAPVVDRFVLCEATLTHSGKPKPLVYMENRKRFSGFPITSVLVDDYTNIDLKNAWALERNQRQVGVSAAVELFHPDLLIVSDCDEIPSAEAVRAASKNTATHQTLDMGLYYYYLNCRCDSRKWNRGHVIRPNGDRPDARKIRRIKNAPMIQNGGWHFSYLGGTEKIQEKLAAFAHREKDVDRWNTPEEIAARVTAGRDLFDRDEKYRFVIDSTLDRLPRYVQDNPARFAEYLCASR